MSSIEIIDFDDPMKTALDKLGIGFDAEIMCRVYRVTGSGGGKSKEFVCTLDYAPEIEEIKDLFGGGVYQLHISAGDKKCAVNIRVAGNTAPAVPVQSSGGMGIENLREVMALIKEMQIVSPSASAPAFPDIMPMMFEQQKSMIAYQFEMQKEQMKQMNEFREAVRAEYELEEDENENENESGSGMDTGNNFDLDSILPLVSEYLPRLLGNGGSALVPFLKAIPIFKEIAGSADKAGAVLNALNDVPTRDKIKLIKMLGLPSELIPDDD